MRTYKRLTKKPGKNGTRRLVLFGIAIFLLVTLGSVLIGKTCYHYLCGSNFFRVSTINIVGCQRLSRDEVRELAKIDIHSNILGISVDEIGRKLERHPWVKQAIVRKELPDVLHIKIIERQPVAILQDNGLYYVDGDAAIISKTNLCENIDYPVITGLEKQDFSSDSERMEDLRKILRILPCKKKVEDVLPARNISELHFDSRAGIIIYTVDGHFPIRLGKGDMSKKLHRLEAVLYDLYRKEAYNSVNYIDCECYNNRILVREKNERS